MAPEMLEKKPPVSYVPKVLEDGELFGPDQQIHVGKMFQTHLMQKKAQISGEDKPSPVMWAYIF